MDSLKIDARVTKILQLRRNLHPSVFSDISTITLKKITLLIYTLTMKYLSVLALFLVHSSLLAQINDLLKDDNVVWIGEFTTTKT
jgi:hypothetical protein